jgi:hypothetical protein
LIIADEDVVLVVGFSDIAQQRGEVLRRVARDTKVLGEAKGEVVEVGEGHEGTLRRVRLGGYEENEKRLHPSDKPKALERPGGASGWTNGE